MMEKEMKEVFEKISLSEQEKGKLWEQITEKHQEKKRKKHRLVPAAAVLVLFFMGMGIYAASSENVIQAVKVLFGGRQEQQRKEEVSAEKSIIQEIWEVSYYNGSAPKILLYTEKRLVFGNTAGLAVYDLEAGRAVFTLDLQKIGCSYIELGSSLETGCLPQGSQMVIFNEESGDVKDCYYILDLEDFSVKKQSFKSCGEERETKKRQLYKKWKQFEKEHYQDLGQIEVFRKEISTTKNMYSYFGYIRKEGGRTTASSLCLANFWNGKEQSFAVITKDLADGTGRKQSLELPQMPERKEELPEFIYTGKDPIEEAVFGYFKAEEEKEKGEVKILMPVLYGIKEKKSSVLVFLSMGYKTYYKSGMVLEENGGGRQAMRLTLKKRNGNYQVSECLKAIDGAGHIKSIEEFTKGYPKIRKRYFNGRFFEKELKKKKREMISMYAEQLDWKEAYIRNGKGKLEKIK